MLMSELEEKSVSNCLQEFLSGIFDSFKIIKCLKIFIENEVIFRNIVFCLVLNGVLYLGSIYFYNYFISFYVNILFEWLLPGYNVVRVVNFFFYIFWLLPMYFVCNVLTSFWVDTIVSSTMEIYGFNKSRLPPKNIINTLSNLLQKHILLVSFFILLSTVSFISPFVGIFTTVIFTCLVNSIYTFEYVLSKIHLKDYKDILYLLEERFFYFIGFGILLSILLNLINSAIINSTIFLMFFPFFLMTSIELENSRFNNLKIEKRPLKILFLVEKIYNFLLSTILKGLNIKAENKSE